MTTEVFLDYLLLFGGPVLLIAIIAFVYRPSAHQANKEAKQIPFNESDRPAHRH